MLDEQDPETRRFEEGSPLRRYRLPPMDESAQWMALLVRLRWVALGALAVVVALAVPVLSHPAWVGLGMALIVVALAIVNGLAQSRIRRQGSIGRTGIFNHIGLDVSVSTLLLMLGGGADNPFVMLYAVNVVLASVVLRAELALAIAGLVLLGFALLHTLYLPLYLDRHPFLDARTLYVLGRAAAFVATIGGVTFLGVGAANALTSRALALERLHAARRGEGEEPPWRMPGPDPRQDVPAP